MVCGTASRAGQVPVAWAVMWHLHFDGMRDLQLSGLYMHSSHVGYRHVTVWSTFKDFPSSQEIKTMSCDGHALQPTVEAMNIHQGLLEDVAESGTGSQIVYP